MFVVAGEALIDLVPQERGPLSPLRPAPGGGPYNTAVALGRLGAEVAFCSRVSTDGYGEALLGGLRASGVDTGPVQRGPEPTTLALALLDDHGSASYTFYVEGTADRLFRVPGRLPEGTRAVSFGTCSLVLEPGATAYEELLLACAARGLFTVLDPNIRAGLIPSPAAYRERFHSWLPAVTLLKLSEEDADWLGGTPREWAAAGPGAVVLTRGSEGLSVVTAAGLEVTAPAPRVEVADTIGAGDTVTAALLHGLALRDALSPAALAALTPDDWQDVLSLAARAAALTCTRPGAQPPTAAELGL
ncbi:carbohydrate kinase family protein [Streptomyces fragilis]|uniref:Carbohydrate kinase n=1 Tax=Streptomyces fragilis TaxID=67301 RepID=A0ABV2YB97_9ACTN|nr:carbohydrate kinase [Streptomyces fragilis]